MDDVTYTFVEYQKERKGEATGARHKVAGSKSRKCNFPSDYLTEKQKKELNGKVMTYEMNKPHTWREVKKWPKETQIEYFTRLHEEYNASGEKIASMLAISYSTWMRIAKDLGIKWKRNIKPTNDDLKAWSEFLHPAPVITKERVEEAKKVVEPLIVPKAPPVESISATLKMEGNPYAVLDRMAKLLDGDKKYRFSISVSELPTLKTIQEIWDDDTDNEPDEQDYVF